MWFNTVEERKEYLKKEEREYKNFLGFIQPIKSVAREFEGKVINSRFEKRLSERVGRYISIDFGYGNSFYVKLYSELHGGCHYYNVPLKAFDITQSGKYRMNAEKFCQYMDLNGQKLREELKAYDVGAIDEARKEFENIAKQFNRFKKKYNDKIIRIAGCDFDLRANDSCDYNLADSK